MNEDVFLSNDLFFLQPEADENPEGDSDVEGDGGARHDTQAEASAVTAAVTIGTTGGDTPAKASVAKIAAAEAAVIHQETEIPQLPEV
jgi:hypothetical protein